MSRIVSLVQYTLCASPSTLFRGQPGVRLNLSVQFLAERRHLPIVTLNRAA